MCTGLLIPHTAFVRVVREMHETLTEKQRFPHRLRNNTEAHGFDGENQSCRWQSSALMALHEMAEHILVMYFELLYIESRHVLILVPR
jgi:histone H3/H4